MREKDLLRIQGPLGTFFLRKESDKPVVLMAGGTGFAPVKAIVEQALADRVRRPMHIFWGARCPDDLYMDRLARSWANQYDNIRYTPVLSETGPDHGWTGETGWVHDAVVAHYPELGGYEVYMSGPPPMIDAGYAAFVDRGLPEDDLYFDSFEFASDIPR